MLTIITILEKNNILHEQILSLGKLQFPLQIQTLCAAYSTPQFPLHPDFLIYARAIRISFFAYPFPCL